MKVQTNRVHEERYSWINIVFNIHTLTGYILRHFVKYSINDISIGNLSLTLVTLPLPCSLVIIFLTFVHITHDCYFDRGSSGEVLWWAPLSVCVCLSVCLSTSISPESHAPSLPIICACCLWPRLGPPPAGWRNPKGKRQFWWFSSPTDNAL